MNPLPTVASWALSVWSNGTVPLLAGLLTAGAGAARWRGEGRRLAGRAAGDRRWRAKLVAWGVQADDEVSGLTGQLHRYWYRVNSTIMVAVGAAVALAGIGQVLATLLRAADLVTPSREPFGTSQFALLYPAVVAGTGVGYLLAVRLGRRWHGGGPRYGDLHRRRLADYRKLGWRWLAAALAVVPIGLTLASGAAWSTRLAFVVPAEMVLAVSLAELLMVAAARAPRLVVAAEPVVARRCDDLVRADVIWRLQIVQLMSVTFGCLYQSEVIGSLAGVNGVAARLLPVVGVVAALAVAVVGFCDGRLGGRVTGWSGRPMPE